MTNYLVTWAIDVDTEGTVRDAARKALAIQRDDESIATVFTVETPTGRTVLVDLLEETYDDE